MMRVQNVLLALVTLLALTTMAVSAFGATKLDEDQLAQVTAGKQAAVFNCKSKCVNNTVKGVKSPAVFDPKKK